MASHSNMLNTTNDRRIPLLVAGSAAFIGAIYGYDQGSIGAAILYLGPDMDLTTFMTTVVVTAVPVGTLFGALIGGRLANAIGRKRAMLVIGVGYTLFTGLQAAAFGQWSIAIVRLFLGLSIGISIVAAPTFIAESSPARFRGRALVSFAFAGVSGIVIAYLVGLAASSTQNWRLILAVGAVLSAVALALILQLPDSPRWYLMRNRWDEAISVLRVIEPEQDPIQQAHIIVHDLNTTRTGTYRQLFRRPYTRAGIFAIGLGLFIQLSGVSATVHYGPTLMHDIGFPTSAGSILATLILQLVNLVADVAAFFLVDRWGRRPVLLSGVSTMSIALALLVVAFIGSTTTSVALLGIFLFLLGYTFGYGALVWSYVAESLPAHLRTIGGSTLLIADTFGNIVVGLFFLNALNALGGAITFAVFLAIAIGALIFLGKLAPETKNRQLEDIRTYWEQGGRWTPKYSNAATANPSSTTETPNSDQDEDD